MVAQASLLSNGCVTSNLLRRRGDKGTERAPCTDGRRAAPTTGAAASLMDGPDQSLSRSLERLAKLLLRIQSKPG